MDSESFELNLEQQFHMMLMQNSVEEMTREQLKDLLIQSTRLIMVKDNVIRGLIKSCGI
ncbi:MAG TPA: NblA/ycf18 family protein [Allocoleopsis sp.]